MNDHINKNFKEEIASIKRLMGHDLLILGHYYQRPEVLEFADEIGDSFNLAKKASESNAKLVVFCGVMFMAESAAILAKANQTVVIPRLDAGCPLAEMADISQVQSAWDILDAEGLTEGLIPITYINSSIDLKAFTGRHGGTCCTSSNAKSAIKWGLKRGKRIFFTPDKNLALNTCSSLGVKHIAVWDPWDKMTTNIDRFKYADVIVWDGYCHTHTKFSKDHIQSARFDYPNCSIIVHPECDPSVVSAADASGSTKFIADYVAKATAGSTIIIGTEINFVLSMALKYQDKKVLPLARSLCPNMFKTSLSHLLSALENPDKHIVKLDANLVEDARIALSTMLEL